MSSCDPAVKKLIVAPLAGAQSVAATAIVASNRLIMMIGPPSE
jgi:hypothetical protein